MDRNAALEEVRRKMREKKGGRARDPMQYVPPQVKENEILKLKFYVLNPLQAGDACVTGQASRTMDLWYVMAGTHWINQRPFECPRIHDGKECAFCQLGFDLLKDTDDEDTRKNIVKTYFPKQSWAVNIYFPPFESTPVELRGKVMWYAMQKTVYDIMESTIMRDASKDTDDPQAFGLFYDPNDAYLFQLEVKRQGDYNEYKASKFLPTTKGPMIKKGNEPDEAKIAEVLGQRHDLFTKFAPRDAAKLAEKAREVLSGEAERKPAASPAAEDKLVDVPATTLVEEPGDKVANPVAKPTASAATAAKSVAKPAAKVTASAAPSVEKKPAAAPAPVSDDSDDELNKLLDDIRKGN
jgi:hypothetical protein